MFQDLSIRRKLHFGFGAAAVILVLLLGSAYSNFQQLSKANSWNLHTMEVLLETNRITTSLLQVQASVRGFVLTGDERLLTTLDAERDAAHAHLRRALALTSDNANQQDRLRRLSPVVEGWLNEVVVTQIADRRSQTRRGVVPTQSVIDAEIARGARTLATVRSLIDEIAAEETRLLEQRKATSFELDNRQQLLLTVGGAAALFGALAIMLALSRAVTGPLASLMQASRALAEGNETARAKVEARDELGQLATEFNRMADVVQQSRANERAQTAALQEGVDTLLAAVSRATSGDLTAQVTVKGDDAIGRLGAGLQSMFEALRTLVAMVQKAGIQVTTSATEIAASAKQQEATGVEQAQTTVEVLATTREISANTQQLLHAMQEATQVADYTTQVTAGAQDNLNRMDATMARMVAATDSISGKLATLSDKAANINAVLTTITKVADQTNILSLNAAIEAEKAGEAGRGFAVVATEIRRLADQTSVSTWDIEQMLKEMQSAVAASVMGMDKFAEEIRRSTDEVRAVSGQLAGVIDQVAKLPGQFDLVLQGMQSQAVGAQQITETMNQLSEAAQQTVDSLKATSEAVHQLQFAARDLQTSVANFALAA
ncbi:HAMP domain-containing protein [Massilia arenosa]|uniref:HAMP domain-containing protein n=1 Tax=Zemynaea arenosa TaxID=2561931 RepID=A0A4Y9SJV9_9BURK|nr:methyl-accepting chemotaxis protein [Massilia arenosa]TFW21360.1 HAMP domain-containing protein [Massilia arenosa]